MLLENFRTKWGFSFLTLHIVLCSLNASARAVSAYRPPDVSGEEIIQQREALQYAQPISDVIISGIKSALNSKSNSGLKNGFSPEPNPPLPPKTTPIFLTAKGSRTVVANANWKSVPDISHDELMKNFANVRDMKLLIDHQLRPRRLTWLYPDDGCSSRAEMMVSAIETDNFTALPLLNPPQKPGQLKLKSLEVLLKKSKLPRKIFAFGSLKFKTLNHPDGMVTWWYHVAPVIRVEQEYYVMDPGMEPLYPLTATEWMNRMGGAEAQIKIAICSPHTYEPDSDCSYPDDSSVRSRNDEVTYYLDEEWERILQLGRMPLLELGDFPPWKNLVEWNWN